MVVIYAGTHGLTDDIPVPEVQRFERELRAYFRAKHADLLEQIRDTGQLPDESAMDAAISELKKAFVTDDDTPTLDESGEPTGGGAGTSNAAGEVSGATKAAGEGSGPGNAAGEGAGATNSAGESAGATDLPEGSSGSGDPVGGS